MSFCPWESYNDSEVLAAGRYDLDISRLELQFRDGKTYEYYDVPLTMWQGFCGAASKGAFFNSRVLNCYASRLTNQGGLPPPLRGGLDGLPPALPSQSQGSTPQGYYDLAMRLFAGKPSDPQVQEQIGVLLRKAADMNHADAQEALFMIYSTRKDRGNDAMLWWHRAQRTRQGLPNSPATDYKPGVMQGGCASLLVIGLLVVGGIASFI